MAVRRGCLTFWYHMYGAGTMGTLWVLKKDKDGDETLWSKNKNIGDRWMKASVDIVEKQSNVYRVRTNKFFLTIFLLYRLLRPL